MDINTIDHQKIYLVISLLACYFNVLVFPLSNYIALAFQILSVLFGFYLLFKKIVDKKIVINKKIIILFLVMLISSFYSFFFNEFGWTIGNLASIISRILMVTCLYIINDVDDYDLVFKITIIASSIIMSINAGLYFINIESLIGKRKYFGIFSNPQPGGAVAMVSLIIALYYIYNKKGNKYLNIICFVTSSFYLLLSKNRSAFFALICLIAISAFMKISKKKKIVVLSIVISLIIAFFIFYLNNIDVSHDFNDYTELEYKLYNISSARYGIYKDAIGLFIKRPLTGISCYNEIEAGLKLLGPNSIIYSGDFEFSHNIFFEVALHGGLLSLIPFCVFVFMLLKECSKNIGAYSFLSYKTIFSSLVIICFFYSQLDSGISGYMLFTSYFFWFGSQRVLR